MNVIRNNAKDIYPTLKRLIKESDFICIDFEMSGLIKERSNQNTRLDTVNS